jgi:pullulanase
MRASGAGRRALSMAVVLAGGSWWLGVHLGWGLAGVWIAYAADEWLRGLLMWRRWRSLAWVPQARAALGLLLCGACAIAASRSDCDGPWQQPLVAEQPWPAAFAAARAVWLDAARLRWPGVEAAGAAQRFQLLSSDRAALQLQAGQPPRGVDRVVELERAGTPPPPALAARSRHVGAGLDLQLPAGERRRLPALLQSQLALVQLDAAGRLQRATRLQAALALDALHADAVAGQALGVTLADGRTEFALWAPTARAVALCLYADSRAPAQALVPAGRSGRWSVTARGACATVGRHRPIPIR